jgi:hypothetical protein
LSGCFDYEDLMQAPRPALQYQRLQEQIDALLADGYSYNHPLTGDHRNAILMADLNGDGVDEAVVFLRSGETESLLTVFFQGNGDFAPIPAIAENAEAVHSVSFGDLTNDGNLDIIVGWQVGSFRFLSVYTLEGDNLIELFSRPFTSYTVYDMEGSGTYALLLVQIDSERQIVEVVMSDNGELSVAGTAALSRGTEAVRRLRGTPLLDGRPGLLVTSQYRADDDSPPGEVTDIFTFREGALVNISVNMETGISDMLVRDREIPAEDINGDGILNLPRQIELPRHPETPDSNGEIFYEIRWNAYESGGLSIETARTYHSARNNWYILLPEQWPGQYTVRHHTANSEAVTTFSAYTHEGEWKDFLKIFFNPQPSANRPVVRGRTLLEEQNNLLVTAEIIPLREGPTQFEMSEQELKSIFKLIPAEWRGFQ